MDIKLCKKLKIAIIITVVIFIIICAVHFIVGEKVEFVYSDEVARIHVSYSRENQWIDTKNPETIKQIIDSVNTVTLYPSNEIIGERCPNIWIMTYDSEGVPIDDLSIYSGIFAITNNKKGVYFISPFERHKIEKICEKYAWVEE